MTKIAISFSSQFSFLLPAIQAHKERIPTKDSPGRPTKSILQIKKELNTNHFGTLFQEFCKRESIYGFGDVQVKRIFNKLD